MGAAPSASPHPLCVLVPAQSSGPASHRCSMSSSADFSDEEDSSHKSGTVSPAPGDTLPWNLPKHERSKRKIQGGSVLDPAERAVLRIAGKGRRGSAGGGARRGDEALYPAFRDGGAARRCVGRAPSPLLRVSPVPPGQPRGRPFPGGGARPPSGHGESGGGRGEEAPSLGEGTRGPGRAGRGRGRGQDRGAAPGEAAGGGLSPSPSPSPAAPC